MGVDITWLNKSDISHELRANIKIKDASLRGISIDRKSISSMNDELPLVAVIATQAQGKTVVKYAQELRVKETDQIKVIVQGLTPMGAYILERADGFEVLGPIKLKGSAVESYFDHRISKSLIIAASYVQGKTVIKQE